MAEAVAARGLGGRDALSAFRAERAAARMRLRATLRADRAALRAGRHAPAEPAAPGLPPAAPEEPSVFAELLGRGTAAPGAPSDEEAVAATAEAAPPEDRPDAPSPADAADELAAGTAEAASPAEAAADAPVPPGMPAAPTEAAGPGAEPPPAISDDPAPAAPPQAPAGLSAIAELGPGMRLRLGQLGIHDLDDLARADVARLRAGLGEISRLLRVERWVEAARALRAG